MDSSSGRYTSIDEYIADKPANVQAMLITLRAAIKEAAPDALEVISYNMPAFKFHGILVYFAAHTNHVGYYPGSTAIHDAFKDRLTEYETSKGTVRFPLGSSVPVSLVKAITRYRIEENLAREQAKNDRKRASGRVKSELAV